LFIGGKMLKNYFKIAVRNLWKHKEFSIINIAGLSIGMACTILILLWVADELSFDRFHKNADNIQLVLRGDGKEMIGQTSILLAQKLKEELPEVINSTNFAKFPESLSFLVQNGNRSFNETMGMAASNFFEVFSFKLRRGNSSTALNDLNSIVITEDIAKKYFGEEDALGKILSVTALGQKRDVRVSGILENMPSNSHIQCQIIIPTDWFKSIINANFGSNFNFWDNLSVQTYIQLKNQCDIQELSSKIKACEIKYRADQNEQTLIYSLLPLTKIHLYGNGIKFLRASLGDIKYVRIFFIIAIIVLLIAGVNYMNLSTALSFKRTKEVGIRKNLGASRKKLLFQFLGESLLLSFIALSCAIILVELLLPEFNKLSGKKLVIRFYERDFIFIASMVTIVTGIISGGYPAFFLSSFQPIQMLKGKLKLGFSGLITRKGLVIFQFALSVIIIICTIVISNQLSFIKNSNLGFDKDNIICIRMTGEANSKYDVLKNELEKNQNILIMSRSESINSNEWGSTGGVSWQGKEEKDEKNFWELYSDYDLASTFKIEMSQGRYFSKQFPTDSANAFVINEAAARVMGMKSPLNEVIQLGKKKGVIIGVTKDFHFSSFHNAIEPLIITIPENDKQKLYFRILAIRINSGSLINCVKFIEKIWKEQISNVPLNYYFYDESLNAQYSAEQRMGTIFKYFSFLSILLACLGLFGLASLSAEQRTKEIGIRKALGATIANITFILSQEFLIWIMIANIIAWPVGFYFMNKWLDDFVYRIGISWWIFILSGGISLIIALATVSFQAIKAAVANPVESLRSE
jgi:putative ABC transport system permease protein